MLAGEPYCLRKANMTLRNLKVIQINRARRRESVKLRHPSDPRITAVSQVSDSKLLRTVSSAMLRRSSATLMEGEHPGLFFECAMPLTHELPSGCSYTPSHLKGLLSPFGKICDPRRSRP